MNILQSAKLILEGKPVIPSLDMSLLKRELIRIQSLLDKETKGKFKIDMKYKVGKDSHLSINIDIEGDEDMFGYIEMTSEAGGYEDTVAMGIDSENVFEAYTYDAKELKKIGISHVKKLVKLYKENSY